MCVYVENSRGQGTVDTLPLALLQRGTPKSTNRRASWTY